MAALARSTYFLTLILLLSGLASAQSGWFSQTSGTTNTLPGVSFADANNGWVVGGTGSSSTILHTTNGGWNWSSEFSPVSQLLNDVHAIDAMTAVAVGNTGTILRTTNGGANWVSITSSTTNSLMSVAFSDASNGWAVGTSKTLKKTANGGASWGTQSVSLGSTGHFRGVAPASSSVVTVLGSTSTGLTQLRIRSTNGGTNWSGQVDGTVNGIAYAVSFGDASTGLIVGQQGVFYKSTNAGSSWLSPTNPASNTLYNVHMVDANMGYIVGESGAIFKTTDGGSNWTNQTTGFYDLRGVHFTDAWNGVAVGSGGTILRTTTSGEVTTIAVSKTGDYAGTPLSPGATDVPVMQLEAASGIGTAFVSTIAASFKSGSSVVDADISLLKVYQDNDNDGTVSVGDVLLGSASFSGGLANVTGLTFPVGMGGETLLLAVDIDAGADPSHTLALEMSNSGSLTSINATSSGFPIESSSESALPVQLTSFTAAAGRSGAELRWRTESEQSNHGFGIERRFVQSSKFQFQGESTLNVEPETWNLIGFVPGAGTSTSPQDYSFSDKPGQPGRYAYRIKQIDHSGVFTYTSSLEVVIGLAPLEFTLGQNYPNPFNPSTTIEFTIPQDGHVTLRVFDLAGREIATLVNGKLQGGVYHQAVFDASKLASGMYVSRLEVGGKAMTRRMVLVK